MLQIGSRSGGMGESAIKTAVQWRPEAHVEITEWREKNTKMRVTDRRKKTALMMIAIVVVRSGQGGFRPRRSLSTRNPEIPNIVRRRVCVTFSPRGVSSFLDNIFVEQMPFV